MLKRKKLLFFLPSNVGGAERMTITIAKLLPPELFEIKFVIVHRSLGNIVKFIPSQFEIIQIPIRNIYCATTLRMLKVIRHEKPDVCFCSLLYLNARLIIASKFSNVRVVVRNNINLYNAKTINKELAKLTYRWADRVIAQQDEMKEEIVSVLKLPSEKVFVLHNPLDTKSIDKKAQVISPYTLGENSIKYVWTGRFDVSKGQDLLISAFKLVYEKNKDAHLFLVGNYDEKKDFDRRVSNKIKSLGLSLNVHIVGFDDNPYKWVKHCDCFVMPSRKEGLPNSLIEAMYLGIPVVATSCVPVVSRIVENGYNGYVVPSENIPALAKGMQDALGLRNFTMTYKPAEQKQFVNIFLF